MNHLIIQKHQPAAIDEGILRTEIAMNQAEFVAQRLPRQSMEKFCRSRSLPCRVKIVWLQPEVFKMCNVGKYARKIQF